MIRKALEILGVALVVLLTSCTGDAYQNVIPRGCTALMAIDMQEKTDNAAGDDAMPMAALFGLENIEQSGIDLSSTVYLFESPDGYFGLAASVRKASLVEQWMTDLQSKGSCKLLPERKGKRFAVLKESWMLACDNDKLLVMGPVVATQQAELVVQMARYMQQPEKQSIKDTPIFQKLSEMQAPMAFVAQTAALPEALAAAFAIGAPQEADASQVMLAAEMEIGNGTLLVKGETFSFNKAIDQAIQASQKSLRPMNGKYLARLPQASLTWMSNVEGNAFYTLLEQNKALKGLLTGANVSFDFRQVVNGVDGDMVVVVDSIGATVPRIMMLAQKSGGAADVFSSTDKTLKADDMFDSNQGVLSTQQQAMLKGARCAIVVQLSRLGDSETVQMVKSLLQPLFGDIDTIVYVAEK